MLKIYYLQVMTYRTIDEIEEILASGTYQGIRLRGGPPLLSYREKMIDGLITALKDRFILEDDTMNVYKATTLLHPMHWPKSDSDQLKDFKICL